jgi:TetR/AcrR family transcriptional regulator
MIAVRERNPERSRERLLVAGLAEFAAKGFAGARVSAIAARARLNPQLIQHHFGGKLGLYRSVMKRRRSRGGGEISAEPGPMPESLARFHALATSDPEWIRVLLWETLERGQEAGGETLPVFTDDRAPRYRERVAWIAAEQSAGRLPSDLDPALLFLSLMGAALYPTLLPAVAEIVSGEDPRSEAFAPRYEEHLRRFAAHLAD